MEFLAIIIGAILGWQRGTLGPPEVKAMVVVILGWTAAVTAAAVPDLSLAYFVGDLARHAVVVMVPYALAAFIRRLVKRS